MVQYYVIANLDKREFLHPDAFGSGQGLMEFACDRNGVMMGLAIAIGLLTSRDVFRETPMAALRE